MPTHQSRYQREAIARGLCSQCFAKPLRTKWHCAGCAEKQRLAARNRAGCKAWRKGGRGRPPK